MKHFFALTVLLALAASPAFARVDDDDVEDFCAAAQATAVPPMQGQQFDGHPANAGILALEEGEYDFPNGLKVEVFDDNQFLAVFPASPNAILGSKGPTFMPEPGMIGGCSLEQLSEVLRNNGVLPKIETTTTTTTTITP